MGWALLSSACWILVKASGCCWSNAGMRADSTQVPRSAPLSSQDRVQFVALTPHSAICFVVMKPWRRSVAITFNAPSFHSVRRSGAGTPAGTSGTTIGTWQRSAGFQSNSCGPPKCWSQWRKWNSGKSTNLPSRRRCPRDGASTAMPHISSRR